jgi:hypothetical protein
MFLKGGKAHQFLSAEINSRLDPLVRNNRREFVEFDGIWNSETDRFRAHRILKQQSSSFLYGKKTSKRNQRS